MIDCFAEPDVLADYFITALQALPNSTSDTIFISRVEVEVVDCDLLIWLSQQSFDKRLFWEGRDGLFSVSAIGECLVYDQSTHSSFREAVVDVESMLSISDEDVRFYGGHAFSEASLDSSWADLGAFHLAVPRFELLRRGQYFFCAFNYLSNECREQLSAVFDHYFYSLKWQLSKSSSFMLQPYLNDNDRAFWVSSVEKLIGRLGCGLDKLVVGRINESIYKESIDPFLLLDVIAKKNIHTFNFCFSHGSHFSFLGCSPEVLFSQNGGAIVSEAIAGTRLIGDENMETLSHSPKNIAEQRYVYDDVITQLSKVCSSVSVVKEMEMLSLQNLEHLMSSFEGKLRPDFCVADIIDVLHPTAAICGTPREESMKELSQYEFINRGWFSAPVGWISKGASEFCVAIRSARINDKTLTAFAAAGIVTGSVPGDEYIEITNKMSQFFS